MCNTMAILQAVHAFLILLFSSHKKFIHSIKALLWRLIRVNN